MSDILQVDHVNYHGRIAYLSKKPDRMDQERGRERFTITVHSDGHRTCMAQSEIDDRPSVMRNTALTLDEAWHPLECFVRISVGDRFMGSGWFRFSEDEAECETYTAIEGRVSQKMSLIERPRAFVDHAIICDAWVLKMFDLSKGPGVQTFPQLLLSSPDHRGATGPLLFRISPSIEFVGEEKITVGAGEFGALHFRFGSTAGLPNEHPPYDVWCTADGHYIFLRGAVYGYMMTYYELVDLEIEHG